ncbi:MAG: 4-alpha-glucanotransferase [Bryobacterales bacterium]|nr:4-alpha-glucanotransferase [Bryobacterales bacterium]
MPYPPVIFQSSFSYEDAVSRAAAESRIDREYWDIFHKLHQVSHEAEKGILVAMGWDVSNTDVIERQRADRFRKDWAAVLPITAVISESEKAIYTSLPMGHGGQVSFQIDLEGGGTLAGSPDLSELEWLHDVHLGNERWARFKLCLPTELPLGYHSLRISSQSGECSAVCHLIVCPDRAYIPENLATGGRTAGFNVTLYGLRSDRNWGCGDFSDLRTLIDWAHDEVGFSFVGLNPLHALHNRAPYNTSPYLPLSLYYKNFIYIDVPSVPEFAACSAAQHILNSAAIQEKLRQLRASDLVAYQDVAHLKRRFLKLLYRQFRRSAQSDPQRQTAFTKFCQREGDLLHNFALYSALDEILHKQDRNRWTWQHWPSEYHDPNSEASRRFAEQHARTVEFYKYIQFVIEEQLTAAQAHAKDRGLSIGLYHDLALATDSCGSDLWAYRDFYVNGCRVGAPPDDFSPNGQDWAFPPPNSDVHRDTGYRLYRESIRKIVTHGGALRIDHVMRLIRLFWIPNSTTAAEGTYVRDYATDLMRILALESVRSQNIIIGEDLGTVTDEMREMLGRFGILSYRLFYFEKNKDGSFKRRREYPIQALVSSSTHDLATMAGFWKLRDIEARRSAGLVNDEGYRQQSEDRKREKQQMLDVLHEEHLLPDGFPHTAEEIPEVNGELHNAIVAFLAGVPSMLLLLNGEDLTLETEQQNLPGSTAEYPNWQRKMKVRLEDLRTPACQPYAAMFRHQLRSNGR